jgi:hypothetical protein
MKAARVQKRERWAAKPNTKPTRAPAAARTVLSPQVSNKLARSNGGSLLLSHIVLIVR